MILFSIRLRIIFIAIFSVLVLCSSAGIISNEVKSKTLRQFERVDIDISLNEKFSNPYWANEIALDIAVVAPSGKKLKVPCFYLSGQSGKNSLWQARFTPVEAGAYQYSLELSRNGKLLEATDVCYFSTAPSSGKGFLRLNNNWSFKFDNGDLFRGIGENICWEARSNDDSKYFKQLHEQPKYNYRYMLSQLAANGGNYFRTWMCSWNLPLEWKQVSANTDRYVDTDEYFNPDGIVKMDEFVDLCDSLGLYVMLAIDQSGNYSDWSWGKNNYNVKNGGFAKTPFDFFILSKSKEQYKNRLRYLVARWGYSPSIGAWEFFNEIDHIAYDNNTPKPDMIQAIVLWHSEMAAYLKSIDPYEHLVTTSISHRNLSGLNDIDAIDFNQQHIYKHTSEMPRVLDEYSQNHSKPYVIGEFGYEWDWSLNLNDFAEDMDRDYKKGLWLGLFSPTPVLPLSWWWEYFEDRGLFPYFKNVRQMNDYIMSFGKGNLEPFTVKLPIEGAEVYGLKHGRQAFIYIHIDNGIGETIDLHMDNELFAYGKVQGYNCESGQFFPLEQVEINEGKLFLSALSDTVGEDLIITFQIGNGL